MFLLLRVSRTHRQPPQGRRWRWEARETRRGAAVGPFVGARVQTHAAPSSGLTAGALSRSPRAHRKGAAARLPFLAVGELAQGREARSKVAVVFKVSELLLMILGLGIMNWILGIFDLGFGFWEILGTFLIAL